MRRRFATSELVTQCYLDDAARIDGVSWTFWYAERATPDEAVQCPKHMPIERVRNVHLQDQGLALHDARIFGNRKVLAEVRITSDIT